MWQGLDALLRGVEPLQVKEATGCGWVNLVFEAWLPPTAHLGSGRACEGGA